MAMSGFRTTTAASAEPIGRGLRLSGGLLVAGLVLNTVATAGFHPSGNEDNHEEIFTEYAESSGWEAVHFAQFIGGLLVVAGLIALYRALSAGGGSALATRFGATAAVATAATLAVLQGLDGIGLKQAVDAWIDSSGAERADRFSDAEIVRWLEWGFQSYFRILLGLSFALLGWALLSARLVASSIGWAGILAGLFSAAIGVDVAYNGLESDFQSVVGMALLVAVLVFSFGLLVSGGRSGRVRTA
jgi:hypothetical protein